MGITFAVILGIAIIAVIGVLAWNKALQRQVVEKTADLRKSEEKYRSILNNALEGMYQTSPEGAFLNANPAMAQLLGYESPEDLIANLTDVRKQMYVDPGLRDDILARLEKENKISGFEMELYRKDGSRIWVSFTSRAHRDAAGRLLCLEGFMSDITERKKTDEKQRAANRQLQDILEFLPDATFVIDQDKKVLAWNRAIEEMTGVPKKEILGKGDYAYAVPFYGERRPILIDLVECPIGELEESYDVAGRRGHIKYIEQYLPTLYGGRGAYVWATASPLCDKKGNLMAAVESIRDVTYRKQAEERLKETNRELDAFVYTLAHDLRTPLTVIIGYADYLHENCREKLTPEELGCLENISNSGREMDHLMEDLLALARAGQLERPAVPVETTKVADGVICAHAGQLAQAGMTVEVGPLPSLPVPKTLLVQMLDNLLGNAIRYGKKEGSVIRIGGERNGSKVRLFVSDQGPGIPPQERQTVFEAFYRGSTGKHEKGSGIGLATVQKIAKLYDGAAWAEETPGGGCTFWVEMADEMPREPSRQDDP